MTSNIMLKDLKLGKTDAKNELLEGNEAEKTFFENSFFMPENLSIEDFIQKNIFFITGMKGTGKTALMRYLDLELKKRNPNSVSDFILFKSDISEEERNRFAQLQKGWIADKDGIEEVKDQSYRNVWEWFIFRQIFRLHSNSSYPIFENDEAWQYFAELINLPLESKSGNWLSSLGVKITDGNIEINAMSKHLQAKLNFNFIVEDKNTSIPFSLLVEKTYEVYQSLTSAGYALNLFIDELEVSFSNSQQYKRDICLIRDLILTIEKLNRNNIKYGFPIKIIAGIRNEVISATESVGHEINKAISDFGQPLNWNHSGDDYANYPLLKLLVKRIQASEIALGREPSTPDEVWCKYFPERINTIDTKKYILQLTWDRPRDIIRLLDISKKHFGNETMFSQKVFEGIGKIYSKESWVEMTEELATIYSAEEIKAVKNLLTGIQCPFDFSLISKYAEAKASIYKNVDKLLQDRELSTILTDLFDVGIIGNSGKRTRFKFREDDDLLLEKQMKVVDPLWKYLSITKKQGKR